MMSKGLRISVLHMDPKNMVDQKPKISADNIADLGFRAYSTELFEAPPTIKY